MRRGIVYLCAAAVVSWLPPCVFAQYYPLIAPPGYGAAMPPPPGYGYPGPTYYPPVYQPYPTQTQNYYSPVQQQQTRTQSAYQQPASGSSVSKTTPAASTGASEPSSGPAQQSPPANGDAGCDVPSAYGNGGRAPWEMRCMVPPAPCQPPQYNHNFFVNIGANGMGLLLANPAAYGTGTYNTKTFTFSGPTSTTNFAEPVLWGPAFEIGYVLENGWGLRGDGWYMSGSDHTTLSNGNPGTAIFSPLTTPNASGINQVIGTSPVSTLAAQYGTQFALSPNGLLSQAVGTATTPDQITISRYFSFAVADVELICQWNIANVFFTFGIGGRYANARQSYNATSNNFTFNGASSAIPVEQTTVSSSCNFQGVGPTFSLQTVFPILGDCLAFYGNVRGSVLYGQQEFIQRFNDEFATNGAIGLPTGAGNTALPYSSQTISTLTVPVFDLELGIQFSTPLTRGCILFGRAGFVTSYWWGVGNPTSISGNLDLAGGTLKLGIVY